MHLYGLPCHSVGKSVTDKDGKLHPLSRYLSASLSVPLSLCLSVPLSLCHFWSFFWHIFWARNFLDADIFFKLNVLLWIVLNPHFFTQFFFWDFWTKHYMVPNLLGLRFFGLRTFYWAWACSELEIRKGPQRTNKK